MKESEYMFKWETCRFLKAKQRRGERLTDEQLMRVKMHDQRQLAMLKASRRRARVRGISISKGMNTT
jgi:hypothetical protein